MTDTYRTWVSKALRAVRAEVLDLPLAVIQNWPGRVGYALRARYYRARFKSAGRRLRIGVGVTVVGPEFVTVGDDVAIDHHVVVVAGPPAIPDSRLHRKPNPDFRHSEGELVIGNHVHLAPHCVIQAHGGVSIGSQLTVAAGAKIYSLSHHYRNPADPESRTDYRFVGSVPQSDQFLVIGPITIGDAAAVGLNAIVLPGAAVGNRAWVGAAAVVAGPVPADHVVTSSGALRPKGGDM